jgi:hypothetical protein
MRVASATGSFDVTSTRPRRTGSGRLGQVSPKSILVAGRRPRLHQRPLDLDPLHGQARAFPVLDAGLGDLAVGFAGREAGEVDGETQRPVASMRSTISTTVGEFSGTSRNAMLRLSPTSTKLPSFRWK